MNKRIKMLKASTVPNVSGKGKEIPKSRIATYKKRAHPTSSTPASRGGSPTAFGRRITERRCHSLSPSYAQSKKSVEADLLETNRPKLALEELSFNNKDVTAVQSSVQSKESIKEPSLPHSVMTKMMRTLATKKREFSKLSKVVIQQQNNLLEQYAAVKDLESRLGMTSDPAAGDVRLLSVHGWPAHDLLLLVRDDLQTSFNTEISLLGNQILQQLYAQLNPIPEEVLELGAEIMARRIDLLNLLRGKHRADRATYLTNLEWKNRNNEFDQETEKLHRQVVAVVENLKSKLNFSLNLAKIPWLDREALVRKIDKIKKDNMLLQQKIEELAASKREQEVEKDNEMQQKEDKATGYQAVCEELAKEKAAREALKDVVTSAENMLRAARARISALERQLKEARNELDLAKRKQKELEQLVNSELQLNHPTHRHREATYDARSRKLIEVSKNGEITIDTLSRQRDILELRVKELREQVEMAEKTAAEKEAELKLRVDSLQAKVAEKVALQEKTRKAAEARVAELEGKLKEVEEHNVALKERAAKLVELEKMRCLEYVPNKESEPSDRETEIWKELQVTRMALARAEEELKQSREDKDNFLNSLNRIAQEEDADAFKDKMMTELLERERTIAKLQLVINEQRDNEKLMEQSMTQYENQLANLRLEVKRLRNYDCYSKEESYQDLQNELTELQMQVASLSRERAALVSAAASRALMLERHERSAELFARMTRARRDLAALIDQRPDPPPEEDLRLDVTRSLSCMSADGAETWSALRAERARVLRLESAVVAQNLQLEREGRVRTQLERRRAMLERELLRLHHSPPLNDNAGLASNWKLF